MLTRFPGEGERLDVVQLYLVLVVNGPVTSFIVHQFDIVYRVREVSSKNFLWKMVYLGSHFKELDYTRAAKTLLANLIRNGQGRALGGGRATRWWGKSGSNLLPLAMSRHKWQEALRLR